MAWCTKCKKEYSDEFSSCPNCNTNPQSTSALGSELMDSLKPSGSLYHDNNFCCIRPDRCLFHAQSKEILCQHPRRRCSC